METNNLINITYTCGNCSSKVQRQKEDRTGYYENRMLSEGDDPSFRCRLCKLIKPVDCFDYVNKKRSQRRRKSCRSCYLPVQAERAREKRRKNKLIKFK